MSVGRRAFISEPGKQTPQSTSGEPHAPLGIGHFSEVDGKAMSHSQAGRIADRVTGRAELPFKVATPAWRERATRWRLVVSLDDTVMHRRWRGRSSMTSCIYASCWSACGLDLLDILAPFVAREKFDQSG